YRRTRRCHAWSSRAFTRSSRLAEVGGLGPSARPAPSETPSVIPLPRTARRYQEQRLALSGLRGPGCNKWGKGRTPGLEKDRATHFSAPARRLTKENVAGSDSDLGPDQTRRPTPDNRPAGMAKRRQVLCRGGKGPDAASLDSRGACLLQLPQLDGR